jgi:plasmid stabilization system protein ParE
MAYAVELTLRAERDLEELNEYLAATSSEGARRWFNGLKKAIYTPERFLRRCPRAPEAGRSRRPLRHLLYGTNSTPTEYCTKSTKRARRFE